MTHKKLDEFSSYSSAEQTTMILRMKEVASRFYREAQSTNVHAFLEFCGLMNEFVVLCESALATGADFTQANRHSGVPLPMETHHAAYLGEKIGCIYGPSLSDPRVFQAFVESLDLPFEVQIVKSSPVDDRLGVWLDPGDTRLKEEDDRA